MPAFNYPPARTVPQTDDYHGTLVADPYRWLEDTDSAETRAWIAAQNALTQGYLSATRARELLRGRLTELWDYARAYAPVRRGGCYFQLRNTGLQNHNVLWVWGADESDDGRTPMRGQVTKDEVRTTEGGAQAADGGRKTEDDAARQALEAARILLDPNTLSPDGTVSLEGWSVSEDGRYLAYALSGSGSDWRTWHVREVETGRDLPDRLAWSKFSGAAWAKDGSGFYYGRYDPPAPGQAYAAVTERQQLYFHRLGDPQTADMLIYERPDQPKWAFHPHVTDDGRYLVLHVSQGSDRRNRLFYQDLGGGPVVELIAELEASFDFVDSDGPVFFLHTDLEAPNGRVMAVDTRQPDRAQWRTLISEQADALRHVLLAGGQFVALYLHDGYHVLRRFALDGAPLGDIPLPTLGSISVDNEPTLSGRRDADALFYVFHSFAHPFTVYRHDLRTGASEAVFTAPVKFDFGPYVTRQVFVASRDGTRVPMFLVHRKDVRANAPTLLFGYGGFNLAQSPSFQPGRLAWLELGGVFAVAGLRGGSEYGEAWHQAGSLLQKQNTFDDFIACAEYLIAESITTPARLAIEGRSNGGLLVGACLAQRPDLFGAAVPHVGVMDMLRFHKFTIGWAWVSDYGSADDPEQFQVLRAYSPLHNLRPGTPYPATLITTADHDDRVVPGHSFKFAAALQAAQGGEAPILIRVQAAAGHGGARKPVNVAIAEQTDMYTFLVLNLSVDY
jgi:prolyl oligopeptidase